MKKILLGVLLFLPISVLADSITGKFKFTCEVQDQHILKLNEGKSSEAEGYLEGEEEGTLVTIAFSYSIGVDGNVYVLHIDHAFTYGYAKRIQVIGGGWDDLSQRTSNRVFNYSRANPNRIGENQRKLFLSDDTIYMSNEPFVLRMNRYYKNDWNLLYYAILTPTSKSYESYMVAANCMNVPNEYDDLLDQLDRFHLANDK